ncbi:MAG TPA: hypothetical protein VHL34_08600 [Rhizomicrobium sp.]|jgi:DNA-binding MarR family transcriptional regulator|nr:hypothetical protein [Rhizomicrobium sp.]
MAEYGLAYWNAQSRNSTVTDEAMVAMRSHPRFRPAVRVAMAEAARLYDADPTMRRTLSDTGRGAMGFLALYLDATGGLTLGRINDLMHEIDAGSRGRAAAFLIWLRMIGYIEPSNDQPDKRSRLYSPTPHMHAAISALLRKDIAALSQVVPAAAAVLPIFDQPDVFDRFLAELGRGIVDVIKSSAPERAFMRIFASRNSGNIIVQALLSSSDDDDTFPPSRPVPASVAALAKRFDTSRSHVLRMLRDAEDSGLLVRDAEAGTITILPAFGEEVLEFFTVYFVGLAACCYHALSGEAATAA